ncbi:Eco57I restriction-modification methylase domain-containing protein [Vibrio parahaemolyticus]|uniref:Eco57I restriction-modification methylase domain-containing protein n=1 Tax=Vibrio parahaemolyticus TaxID=670 RepID=UPI00235E123D|nr:type IIL restriction-modification enzyme MmeI [Vibrio parahaemolyticus]
MAFSTNQHADWLSLIEVSGPFLAEPILNQAFPQGLEKLDSVKKRQFRQTYDEWREVIDSDAPEDLKIKDKIHQQWTNWVLKFGLELDEDEDGDVLKDQSKMHASIEVTIPEHQVTIKPEYAVVASDETKPYMLIQTYPAGTALSEVLTGDSWSTTPAERMAHLCRGVGTRLGLITNGEQWMFIDAPVGGITTYASWYARLWGLEPITLKAFYSLFNIGVVFNGFDEAKTLPELIDESLQHQDDVTQTLGVQVSRAVEVLIQSIDRINHDHNGELLEGVEPEELYEAGLTLMMRLVFLLCAEERGLLLLGDQAYEANYAISTLRAKLREDASLHGDEVLSYRKNAWARLLAIFRSVYSGVEHENMRMPALGGSLFDPDRFPFLEGRKKGSSWLEDDAKPLPIDNRTVLLFLDAIQLYQGRTLSYRALDVEQIGYVYEGLLEQTVKRAPDVTLELSGSKSCKKPWVQLGELASAALDGLPTLKSLLKERTGSSPSRITNDLNKEVTDADVDKLLVACYNDMELCQRIKPYYHFLRFDAWGNPLLYPKGAFMLTTGTDRRETGSHYTPKSLTESIVTETLEPVVYTGPAEGKPREEWQLKSPEELLDLKICDPAMGSGAFLVQVCRWLAERVCESWLIAEQTGIFVTVKGATTHDETMELLPIDAEERLIVARRLISERCLYGVDINPLAVELAKLSIWLVTLSKNRPFGFLDHNLKSGDSLLGIHDLEQLCYLNLDPSQTRKLKLVEQSFTKQIKALVADTLEIRKQIASHDINVASDVDEMAQLEELAKEKILLPKLIADALIGLTLESGGKLKDISVLSSCIQQSIAGDEESINILRRLAIKGLYTDLPEKNKKRKSFHWNLEFPEVFNSLIGGFDAIVGNPPFIGGQKISGTLGTSYREYLVSHVANGERASCDLVAYIFRRVFELLGNDSPMGLIAVNTIAEGETRQIGLDNILARQGIIYSAHPGDIWPGTANVVTSRVLIWKGDWQGRLLIGNRKVAHISSSLTERETLDIQKLNASRGLVFQGVIVLGDGFVLDHTQEELIQNSKFVYPYLIGQEVNSDPRHSAKRYSINFWDIEEHEAQEDELAFSYLENTVKQERQKNKRKVYKDKWWQYAEKRPAMFHAIGKGSFFNKHPKGWTEDNVLEQVIVFATQATKYPCFTFVPNKYIYANSLCVIASDSMSLFACLSSDFHAVWAFEHGSRLHERLRYTHGDIFETFPFPEKVLEGTHDDLNRMGREFFDLRAKYMLENQKGMTKFYNDLHDQTLYSFEISALREKQIALNAAVLAAYGFNDLEPEYGFHCVGYLPEGKNTRFTISEKAREEILYRLAMLNKTRHEAEQG